MALGTPVCNASVEAHLVCTVITVQRVYDSYHGRPCIVYNTHAANLSWTAEYHAECHLQCISSELFNRPLHDAAEYIADYGDNVQGHFGHRRSNLLLCGDGCGLGRHSERPFESADPGDYTFAVEYFRN